MGQGEFNFGELVSGQVVDWVAHDEVDVDRSNLVDQHPGGPAGDLELGPMD